MLPHNEAQRAKMQAVLVHGTFSIQSSQCGQASYHLPVSKITAGKSKIIISWKRCDATERILPVTI